MALRAPAPSEDESVGALVQRLGNDVSRIVRAEIALVQLRITEAVRVAKSTAIGVVAAVLLTVLGLAVVVAGVVLIVATVIPAWLAAFAVGGGLLLVGGILLIVEVRMLSRGVSEALSPVDGRGHGE